eukprot:TRINITY_DN13219_c0_g3_i5.p1 TRINITY_DN13219_c0_g3~~TRINITY_DN13219_c0_g3_i5.p1  ORF type:complete len:117 (+),score=13.70 TRINITY_DN13219_c0_g3_i5:514-864(+)
MENTAQSVPMVVKIVGTYFRTDQDLGLANEITIGNITDNLHVANLAQYSEMLTQRLEEVAKSQMEEIIKEVNFRDTVNSTNNMIQWCVIVQTLVFCILGAWQIYSVRRFFLKRGII